MKKILTAALACLSVLLLTAAWVLGWYFPHYLLNSKPLPLR